MQLFYKRADKIKVTNLLWKTSTKSRVAMSRVELQHTGWRSCWRYEHTKVVWEIQTKARDTKRFRTKTFLIWRCYWIYSRCCQKPSNTKRCFWLLEIRTLLCIAWQEKLFWCPRYFQIFFLWFSVNQLQRLSGTITILQCSIYCLFSGKNIEYSKAPKCSFSDKFFGHDHIGT